MTANSPRSSTKKFEAKVYVCFYGFVLIDKFEMTEPVAENANVNWLGQPWIKFRPNSIVIEASWQDACGKRCAAIDDTIKNMIASQILPWR